MNTDAVTLSEKKEQQLVKKKYERPRLETYGGIRELTKIIALGGDTDGGIIPPLNMTEIVL